MSSIESINLLIQQLDSQDITVRERAKEGLTALGSMVVEPLIAAMSDPAVRKPWEAAHTLGAIEDPRWIEPMQHALTSPSPLLAHAAARAMESLGAPAVSRLLSALPHCRSTVQLEIIAILGRLGDAQAVLPLMTLLREVNTPELRYTLIETLGLLGDAQAAALIRSFKDDENHHVRTRVQTALRRLGNGVGSSSEDSDEWHRG